MRLFLTHIDTPYRMLHETLPFSDPHLMVSACDIPFFDEVRAVLAFWCNKHLSDEDGWQENRAMRMKAKEINTPHFSYTRGIEDARILGSSPLRRLAELYDDGVRFLTPMWQGENRLGGGYDTESGLTAYGKRILSAAMEMEIIPDISHASDQSAREILQLAKIYRTPVCASHSNFFSVTPHPRNLSDRLATAVAESGGFVGLSLVPSHVGHSRDIAALLLHIDHAYALGVHEALTLGGYLDGTDELIAPLKTAKDLLCVSDAMKHVGYTDMDISALFYDHAARICDRRFPCLFYHT